MSDRQFLRASQDSGVEAPASTSPNSFHSSRIAECPPSTPPRYAATLAAIFDMASLETLAERGRIVPELADAHVRELLVFKYRLLYRVSEDAVTIVAFLRGVRDFTTWRKDQVVDE
jgi:hypothetical protein